MIPVQICSLQKKIKAPSTVNKSQTASYSETYKSAYFDILMKLYKCDTLRETFLHAL